MVFITVITTSSIGSSQDIFDLLSDFIDEEIDMDFGEEIEQHMHSCPCCRHFFNTFRKTVDLFEHFEMVDVPEETHERLIHTIEIEIREHNITIYKRKK